MSDRTARLYMQLARERGAIEAKMATVANLTMGDAIRFLAEAERAEDLRYVCNTVLKLFNGELLPDFNTLHGVFSGRGDLSISQ